MNPEGSPPPQQNNALPQTQAPAAAQGQQANAPQQRAPPMYQPQHIRNLPHLTEEEKRKYEMGLKNLWGRANTANQGSPEYVAARQKIIDFSRMLIGKIQTRRTQQQQTGQGQPAMQAQPSQTGQPQQPQQPQQSQQPQPAQQTVPQQPQQGQAMQQAPAQQQQVQPQAQSQPVTTQQNAPAQVATQQQQKMPPTQPANPTQMAATTNQGNAQQNQQATAAAAQKPKISEQLLQHVNKIIFRPPLHVAEKSTAEASKWIDEMRDRYARALMTMESSKKKITSMDQYFADRKQQGNPLKDDELRAFQIRKEQQVKLHGEAFKWIEGVRKQQGNLHNASQANQNAAAANPAAGNTTPVTAVAPPQQTNNSQGASNMAQPAAANVAAPVNAATEAAKNQQAAAGGRASPSNGVSTPTPAPAPTRPMPSVTQPAAPQQSQVQQMPAAAQRPPQAQPHPPPVNTALASAVGQTHSIGTPTQGAARVQTPQSATPVTAAGPTRALSHSAALSLANQRAATNTPGSAPIQAQQPNAGTPTPTGAVGGQNTMPATNTQHQQGHPHAHPTQSQQAPQSKMPIPKHLPERATAVPQGVAVGGGVNTGRPTMSQGSGTLGGVMNQPAVPKIPAYSHEAEGDHVLSKKKLDELVRQVCGGSADGQEGNMLTPEVEENVLSMADSFVDNVLAAACRNAKERGSKVLEIRDIQLVLERTYNIRVPGYSSDELRTVRKVQPSPGWIAKMSAVQAAKVMPGKTE